MRRGAAVALAVAAGAAGVALVVALASSSSSGPATLPPVSPELRPPMRAGGRYMVTFALPAGLTNDQARALLSFVASWGDMLGPVQFAPDAAGRMTAVVTAQTVRDLPQGPPSIPAPKGELTAYVWAELPSGGRA